MGAGGARSLVGRGGGGGPVRDGRRRRRRRRGRVCGPQSPGAQRQRALGAPDRSAALGRGDRGTQGRPSQGARAPDSPAEPSRAAPPRRAAPPASGAAPRPAARLCGWPCCRGAEEGLARGLWAPTTSGCRRGSTSGAAVLRCAGLRTRPPHKGNGAAPRPPRRSKDCGLGYREGSCGDESRKLKCKIPCNWKKKFGADCKYKFESWGGCSAQTGVKTRSGILKKALYNAECEEVVYVSKPCTAKMKAKAKAKKGKGKD
uniref:Midkine n=1 Tax=Gallus gallus TaxID=9031 RepID=A0A8V0ZRK4_CHICK